MASNIQFNAISAIALCQGFAELMQRKYGISICNRIISDCQLALRLFKGDVSPKQMKFLAHKLKKYEQAISEQQVSASVFCNFHIGLIDDMINDIQKKPAKARHKADRELKINALMSVLTGYEKLNVYIVAVDGDNSEYCAYGDELISFWNEIT